MCSLAALRDARFGASGRRTRRCECAYAHMPSTQCTRYDKHLNVNDTGQPQPLQGKGACRAPQHGGDELWAGGLTEPCFLSNAVRFPTDFTTDDGVGFSFCSWRNRVSGDERQGGLGIRQAGRGPTRGSLGLQGSVAVECVWGTVIAERRGSLRPDARQSAEHQGERTPEGLGTAISDGTEHTRAGATMCNHDHNGVRESRHRRRQWR